jgi:predicted nucleotide-binding protein with TIR-like domain
LVSRRYDHPARDNILLEFGLFAGQLGAERTIICKKGNPKQPIDLGGIVYVNLNRPNEARINIQKWFADLPIEVTRQTLMIALSKENFCHLCGITLLKEYLYHDEYFRREMYVLKDNGLIQPKPPHNTLEFYPALDHTNLAKVAEPTETGRSIVKLRKKDIPPELLKDKGNLKVDPSAL